MPARSIDESIISLLKVSLFLAYLELTGWLVVHRTLSHSSHIFMAVLSQGFVFCVQPPRFVNLRKKYNFSLEFRNFIPFESYLYNFLFIISLLPSAFY